MNQIWIITRVLAVGAALAVAGGGEQAQSRASLLYPEGYRLNDGQLAWKTIRQCAEASPGTWLAIDKAWCRDMIAARLDGWRAAGGKGDPSEVQP